MEVDEDIPYPELNFKGLVLQVDEQSEVCDVTVRTGNWQKKFHRCVLTASLLFQNIINVQLADAEKVNVEAVPDVLEVKTDAPPDVVEMAIMFLYGLTPEFNIGNIGDLFELAEYLKIEELKHACIDWLNKVDYSEVNCMYVMRLSGKYDFDITPCIAYIEGHLPKFFLHDETSELTAEAVEYLFTEDRFSYVDMDDKLNFLVKWAKTHHTETERVIQLFKTLNLPEVSSHVWEDAGNDTTFNNMVHLDTIVRQTVQENSKKPVMIMASEKNYIACLDLENDRWYRLNTEYYKKYPYPEEIVGIRNGNPEVYFKVDDFEEEDLCTVDLNSDQIRTYSVQMDILSYYDVEILDVDVTHMNFTNDTLIATIIKTIQIDEDSDTSESEHESLDSSSPKLNENIISITDIYIGNASGNEVEMRSLCSFRKERVTQICMNDLSVMALLTKSDGLMHVILYDLLQFKMERILPMQIGNYKLCATENGFLMHNDTLCYCFKRLTSQGLSGNYIIENLMLDDKKGCFVRYRYQNGIWMRIIRRYMMNKLELQYISHEELTVCHTSSVDVHWRNVSMPVDLELFDKLELLENIFIVPLSKKVLRCNIGCPHCNF